MLDSSTDGKMFRGLVANFRTASKVGIPIFDDRPEFALQTSTE